MASPLVARDALLASLSDRLAAGDRRLALVGPAGVGKSRLARELLAQLAGEGRRGRFVDLRGAGCAGLIERVADALELEGEASAERIADALAVSDDALLILDNLDDAEDVVGPLRAWGEAAPELGILLTSQHAPPREFTRVRVPTLAPDEAARLLISLVEEARGAALADEERAAAEALAARLDGLPLAVELAAARAELLPLPEIARRARADPAVLGGLRAAVDASWALLSEEEQRALARLSIFERGFNFDAAERVLDAERALDLLHALARKSLLVVSFEAQQTRFSLLESIRAFAAAQLGDADREGAEAQLADWLLSEGLADAPLVHEEDTRRLFRSLSTTDPVRAAHLGLRGVRAANARGSAGELLTLSNALVEAAERAGDASLLARARTRRAAALLETGATDESGALAARVAEDTGLPGDVRANAFIALSDARGAAGRTEEAVVAAEAALEVADDEGARGRAHHLLFILPIVRGEDAGDLSHMREALRLLREAGDEEFLTRALTNFGYWHLKIGDRDQAERYLEEALERARALGERRRLPYFLGNLALLRLDQRRYAEALRFAEEACALAEIHVADTLQNLRHGERGIALAFLGRTADARRAFLRATEPTRGRDADRAETLFGAWRAALDAREPARTEDAAKRAEAALERARSLGRADVLAAVELLVRSARSGEDTDAARAHERAHDAHTRLAARWLAGRAAPAAEVENRARRLLVDEDKRSLQLDAARIDLVHRARLWLVALALIDARVTDPSAALDIEALFEAGWSGQSIRFEAMRNRVYNAVSTLRTLGLGDVLLSLDGGYLLDPNLTVER